VWIKSCLPDCAGSPFYRYSVTVTATLPRNGRFSTVTLRYRYHGKPVVDVRCDSGHGYYDLPPDWPRSATASLTVGVGSPSGVAKPGRPASRRSNRRHTDSARGLLALSGGECQKYP
jgi:hypothetical protein